MTSSGNVPKLIAISGLAAGQVFELHGDDIIIGRDAANAISIADPSLSRRHCSLRHENGGWTICDMGSVNGTLVNGERITERLLADSDHITIGRTELLVRLDFELDRDTPILDATATVTLELGDALYLHPSARLPELARVQTDLLALVRVGSAVASLHERDLVERHLLDAAFDIVPASEAAFVRVDAVEGNPQVVCTRQRAGITPTAPNPGVLNQVLSKRTAILISAATSQEADSGSGADATVRSVLAVPLFDQQRTVGALYLTTADPQAAFDRLHLEVVTALAAIGSAALGNVLCFESLTAESDRLKQDLRISHEMIGTSEAMQRLYRVIAKIAPTDLTVLISGETGTGKELAARALHANSKRASAPFVAINCATLGEHLLESELFGHERGAFTNAVATKRGKFEVADRGTIFLDEIGELSVTLQAKLLRALQQREIERVGGTRVIKIDVRVIAATNRDLKAAVAEGRFRQDLYFRLDAFNLRMPPLRDRKEDILMLAEHFAALACQRSQRPPVRFAPETMQRLVGHDWPGNVREFENVIERAVVLSSEAEIVPEDLPEGLGTPAPAAGAGESRFHAAVDEAKRRVILEAILEADGEIVEAARLLGLHPNYLHRLRNTLNLRQPERRKKRRKVH
jgi:Nif-specific regulatory protein